MADEPKRFCKARGCTRLTTSRFCEEHTSTRREIQWPARLPERHKATWTRQSRSYRKRHPLCEWCLEFDRSNAASVVDHIIPAEVDMELFFDEENMQSLCHPCHNKKTEHHEPLTVYRAEEAKQLDRLVICGKPGVGKSTFARQRGGFVWDWDRFYEAVTWKTWGDESFEANEDLKIMLHLREQWILAVRSYVSKERVTAIFTNRWQAFSIAKTLDAKVFYIVVPEEVRQERIKTRS